MRFYTNSHPYYCGIDLHAKILYVCILDDQDTVIVHEKIPAGPDSLLKLLGPYLGNIVVGVECMHCWYWVSDFCEEHGIDFVLGHALYMKAIHGGKAKNDKIDSFKIAKLLKGGIFPLAYRYPKRLRSLRDLMRRRLHMVRHGADMKAHVSNTLSQYNVQAADRRRELRSAKSRESLHQVLSDPAAQRNIDLDLTLIAHYQRELQQVEWFIEKQTREHQGQDYHLLKTIPGVGKILALTLLLEIGDIGRFETVQQFASYSRLVKCKAESAGKVYGTQGNKIGNAHLKWGFSEVAVCYLKGNEKGQRYLARLQKRMSKGKALTVLAHKLGRCVYYMLKNKQVFDDKKFLTA